MWIETLPGQHVIETGAQVVPRTDSNWGELIATVADALFRFTRLTPDQVKEARKAAAAIAEKAEWKHFFTYYEQAYAIALKKVQEPKAKNQKS